MNAMRLCSACRTAVLVATIALVSGGCGSTDWNPTGGLEQTEPLRAGDAERPLAIVSGAPVRAADLVPVLAELAGADAMRELALDRELERELADRGIDLTESQIEAERVRLEASIGSGESSQAVTSALLRTRGIGPHRFAALLRRNASLRALVEPPQEVTDDALQVAFEVRHGPKRRVRVASFPTARQAALAKREIVAASGTAGIAAAMSEIASARSIDPTARVGGLLGDVSIADPGLPAELRQAIGAGEVGRLSDIIATDTGFVIVLVESDVPPTGVDVTEVEQELRRAMRIRSERLAMESLAEDLLRRSQITPVHPGLRWSWDADSD